MRNKLILLSLVASALLFSCTIQKKIITEKQKIVTAKKTVKEVQKLALYEVIAKETYGGKEERSNVVIKNKEDLKVLNKGVSLNEQIVKLDFLKSNLVVLFMGQKNSGGYSIGVEEVIEDDNAIHIKVKETAPKEGVMAIMALTSPYCIVKINSKKEIIFE